MNGYGSHTFKAVNADNKPVYVKFHFKTDQVNVQPSGHVSKRCPAVT